jgi:hypothetical protein
MDQLASKVIIARNAEKFTSINVKDGYIEFRSPGGDWLNDNFAEIDNTLRRFTVALSAAVDPEAYRQEYLKKLYKLLDVSGEKDPLSYFAKYAAGELPRAALKSFVRQAQAERKVKSGKADAEEYDKLAAIHQELGLEPPQRVAQQPQGVDTRVDYELYSRASGAVIDTFPARNDDEAMIRLNDYREHGAGQSNPDNFGVRRGPGVGAAGASTTTPHPEGRGRPHNPTGRYGIVARSDQAAYGRTGGPPPAYQFRFDMENLEQQGHGRYVKQAWAARNSVDPADYIVVDTTQYADQIPTIDIDVEPAPAPQPAGMGQWNGQWKVLVGGQEVYRFGGVGNSQADANRIAAQWLRTNGQGVSGEGFEVYPVMDESLREYKMPQPSQGPGRYRELNEPLGPETPPKMPSGTVKVDVSDTQDWYQLGQDISNLDIANKAHYNQGPPHTVLAFGSEDLEHMYIQQLKKLGLNTHDLDEPGEEDMDEDAVGQKT